MHSEPQTVDILLVEDNPGDVRLTIEAMKEGGLTNRVVAVSDGDEAIQYLTGQGKFAGAPRPDLILLDLNLPRRDGREVLAEIKQHADLKRIPVIVLTTSQAETDILKAYNLHANCYVTKPVDLDRFWTVIRAIQDFWLNTARLPRG